HGTRWQSLALSECWRCQARIGASSKRSGGAIVQTQSSWRASPDHGVHMKSSSRLGSAPGSSDSARTLRQRQSKSISPNWGMANGCGSLNAMDVENSANSNRLEHWYDLSAGHCENCRTLGRDHSGICVDRGSDSSKGRLGHPWSSTCQSAPLSDEWGGI